MWLLGLLRRLLLLLLPVRLRLLRLLGLLLLWLLPVRLRLLLLLLPVQPLFRLLPVRSLWLRGFPSPLLNLAS